jgi:hypothetical protein
MGSGHEMRLGELRWPVMDLKIPIHHDLRFSTEIALNVDGEASFFSFETFSDHGKWLGIQTWCEWWPFDKRCEWNNQGIICYAIYCLFPIRLVLRIAERAKRHVACLYKKRLPGRRLVVDNHDDSLSHHVNFTLWRDTVRWTAWVHHVRCLGKQSAGCTFEGPSFKFRSR